MITAAICLIFPAVLLSAAVMDALGKPLPAWLIGVFGIGATAAAFAAGLSGMEILVGTGVGLAVYLVFALVALFKLVGWDDAILIGATAYWIGMPALSPFFMMFLGCLVMLWVCIRFIPVFKVFAPDKPPEGDSKTRANWPIVIAVAIAGLYAAPYSPILAAGLASVMPY